jgi:hypothetical protein
MSDLLNKLAQQAQAQVFNRPVVTQAVTKAVDGAVQQAANKASEKVAEKAVTLGVDTAVVKAATKTDLAPEAAKRMTQLLDTNATVMLPSDPARLLSLTSSGRLVPDAALTVSVGNVSKQVAENGGYAAAVLSDEGKKVLALAQDTKGLDGALKKITEVRYTDAGLRFGAETALPTSLDMGKTVKHVLVDAKDHAGVLKTYGEAVARGEAPAAIGGKPFIEFFRSSDDLYNDLQIDAFQSAVPGFAKRSVDEQRAVAALAGRVAADMPAAIPAATRRRVAAAKVSYTPVAGSPNGSQMIADLKEFYKGVPAGKGQNLGEKIAKEGLKAGEGGRYGKGVYHTPSPTTAAGYTYKDVKTAAEIVSGQVDPGRAVDGHMLPSGFDTNADLDTRWIRRAKLDVPDFGDYAVTKDPKRFQIKAITRYQPEQSAGLEALIPDLLEAHRQAPGWTAGIFEQIEPARTRRAFEHALQNGTTEARQSAGFMLARSGDSRGIKVATEALKGASDSKTQAAAGEALREALGIMGDQQVSEAGSILKSLSASKYLTGKESLIASEVETRFGAAGAQLLQENGWQKVMGAKTYWKR